MPEITLEGLAIDLTRVEDRSKSNEHRLNEVERRQSTLEKLASSVEVMAERQNGVDQDIKEIKEDQKEIKTDVKALTEKPGKRLDSIVAALISALVGGGIGYLLTTLLGG